MSDSRLHVDLVCLLSHAKPTTQSLEVLKECLDHPQVTVRRATYNSVWSFTNHAELFLPTLTSRLAEEEPRYQTALALSIWRLSGKTNDIVPVLKRRLELDDDSAKPSVQGTFFYPGSVVSEPYDAELAGWLNVAREMGPQAAALAPLIRKRLESDALWIRFGAALALWKVAGKRTLLLKWVNIS